MVGCCGTSSLRGGVMGGMIDYLGGPSGWPDICVLLRASLD